jgi:hypothetical protein
MPTKLTIEIVTAAIDGFEAQKTRIDAQIAELRAMLHGGSPEPAVTEKTEATPQRKRKRFSAAAIRRMREAQRQRWAKVRGESAPPAAVAKAEPPKPKRRLSKAGRASIVAALKRRWAEKRAALKAHSPVARKSGPAKKVAVRNAVAKAHSAKVAK